MKRTLTFLLTLTFFTTFAQDTPPFVDVYMKYMLETQPEIYTALENGEYHQAETLALENGDYLLELQDAYGDKENMSLILSVYYYDLACLYSRWDRKEDALSALEKANDHGYSDFRQMSGDPDLESVRELPGFAAVLADVRERGDYLTILRSAGGYTTEDTSGYPEFEYESIGNRRIQHVREYLKLDEHAGDGDEISQIKNILKYVHELILHDGSHWAHCEHDAVDLYNYSKANDDRGINCRMLAIVLNECYLSMGFKSRFITCLPHNPDDPDCHVIVSVWSRDLGKWLWMDPSFNAYVTDENGTPLGIAEVRERMIDGRPYFLNEDAYHRKSENPQTKEHYLDTYMAKNLYWLEMPARSLFNVESPYRNSQEKYVRLVPEGFEPTYQNERKTVTHDPDYFWQLPVFDEE